MVEELGGGVVSGSSTGFLGSSGKTSHTVSHSCSVLAMSFCRLAWKEVVVKVIKALIDQRVRRSMERNRGLNGRRYGRFPRALQKSHWETCNNSSTISHSNISPTTHHTLYSIFDATNSHIHSHTTDHLHYTNTTTISITNLTPIIPLKQPRRDGSLHLG